MATNNTESWIKSAADIIQNPSEIASASRKLLDSALPSARNTLAGIGDGAARIASEIGTAVSANDKTAKTPHANWYGIPVHQNNECVLKGLLPSLHIQDHPGLLKQMGQDKDFPSTSPAIHALKPGTLDSFGQVKHDAVAPVDLKAGVSAGLDTFGQPKHESVPPVDLQANKPGARDSYGQTDRK